MLYTMTLSEQKWLAKVARGRQFVTRLRDNIWRLTWVRWGIGERREEKTEGVRMQVESLRELRLPALRAKKELPAGITTTRSIKGFRVQAHCGGRVYYMGRYADLEIARRVNRHIRRLLGRITIVKGGHHE